MKKMSRKLAALSLAGAAVLSLAGAAWPAVSAYGADSNGLQAAVAQVEQMDVSGYTEESVALLQKALNSSAQVLKSQSGSSRRVHNHVTLLEAAARALVKKADGKTPACGNYTIEGILRQASSDSPSMGNGSILWPMEVVVGDEEVTLRIHFTSLTVPGLGQGYLADLSYLPGWEGMLFQMTDEQRRGFQACTVEKYYDGVFDTFNDPDTGIDQALRGKLYPEYLTMPVDYNDPEIWVKVYVPIMESISAGGGSQYARLQMDWGTLTWIEPDKSALKEAVDQLEQLKKAASAADYPQEMIELLEQAAVTGNDGLGSGKLSQSQADAMAQALHAVANTFADADKQYLYDMIQIAEKYTGSDYADDYAADMKERIRAAQAVYNDAFATQTQVNEQYALLLQAVSNPQKKEPSVPATPAGTGKPGTTPVPSGTKTPEKTENSGKGTDQELDKDNLRDGIYAVTGKMVKIDKSTASMSDDAINHTVKLTVKKGAYKITLDFMGLHMNGSYGYLSGLKYFTQGYTLDSYGAPQGTVKAVTVDSYQQDDSGGRVTDIYGTDYPNQVTFPLIPEAVKDGYVPLQVYVPIMEAISAGTGTQPVFLYLDWDTLRSTTKDDDAFRDQESSPGSSAGTGTGTGTKTGLTAGTSRLGSGTPSPGSQTAAAKSSLSASQSKKTAAGLAPEAARSEAATLAAGLSGTAENAVENAAENQVQDMEAEDSSGGFPRLPSPAAVPTVMSVLMAAAGFFFKLKSRGGL